MFVCHRVFWEVEFLVDSPFDLTIGGIRCVKLRYYRKKLQGDDSPLLSVSNYFSITSYLVIFQKANNCRIPLSCCYGWSHMDTIKTVTF